MNLRGAANYFSRTYADGWVQATNTWEVAQVPCTLLPMDRFVSEREFGLKRRYVLVQPDYALPYSVIRFGETGPIYLVGFATLDIKGASYSKVILLHEANLWADLYTRPRTGAASNMGKAATPTLVGSFPFSIERVTSANFKEFTGAQTTDSVGMLPNTCPVTVSTELHVGGVEYQVQEVFASSGFTGVRVLSKNL